MSSDSIVPPTADPVPPRIAPPRHHRWLRRLALGLAVLTVVLLVSHLVWSLAASAQLRDARATAKSVGLTINATLPPPCADEANAALRYLRAYTRFSLHTFGSSSVELDPRLEDLLSRGSTRQERAELARTEGASALALLDHDDFIRAWVLLAEGARLKECRFPATVYAADAMARYWLARHLVLLGALRAQLLTAAGRPQEAADLIADLLLMLGHLDDDTWFLGPAWGSDLSRTVMLCLRDGLADGSLAKADLVRCTRILADRVTDPNRLQKLLRDDYAQRWEPLFRSFTTAQSLGFKWDLTGALWSLKPYRDTDEAAVVLFLANCLQNPALLNAEEDHPDVPRRGLIAPNLPAKYRYCVEQWAIDDQLKATALLALRVAAGETPVAPSGITMEHGNDGAWTISPWVDQEAITSTSAKVLVPWRVPPRR